MTSQQHAMLDALIAVSGGDALFRPSAAPRWMKCRGSVQLSARAPRDDRRSIYADEGTAAHIVLNHALSGERRPEEYVGRQVRFDKEGMRGWFVDAEMAQTVQWCVDRVQDVLATAPDWEVFLEHQLTLGALDPSDPLLAQNRGTGDVVLVNRRLRWIIIVDLKYGRGVMVAGDSAQLLDYATMGLVAFGADGGWDRATTIVLQPRIPVGDMPDLPLPDLWENKDPRFKCVDADPNDLLLRFLGEIGTAMEESLADDPPLVVGDHCRWCPARPICPALRAEALAIGSDPHGSVTSILHYHSESDSYFRAMTFNPGDGLVADVTGMPEHEAEAARRGIPLIVPLTVSSAMPAIPAVPALLESADMDPADIATVLERRKVYDSWIESVEHRAAQMIEAGITVPGWALERRSGNRRFKGIESAEGVKTLVATLHAEPFSMKDEAIFTDPEIRSPAQIEKRLPKAARPSLEKLVERPEGSLQLVRASAAKALADKPMAALAIPEAAR